MRASTLPAVDGDRMETPKRLSGRETGALSIRQIDTAQWQPKDRCALWTGFIAAQSTPVAMPNTPLHDYRAAAILQDRDAISINRAVSDPLGTLRTRTQANNHQMDRVRIAYCRRVDGGIEAGDKATRLWNGSVYFRDERSPGRFWTHAPLEETWLSVPRDWLVDSGGPVPQFDGAVFHADGLFAALMAERIGAVLCQVGDDLGFPAAIRA